jgi:hypothetical protein
MRCRQYSELCFDNIFVWISSKNGFFIPPIMASVLRSALRPVARGYATSVTGFGREVEGFVGAVGNTPLVGPDGLVLANSRSA